MRSSIYQITRKLFWRPACVMWLIGQKLGWESGNWGHISDLYWSTRFARSTHNGGCKRSWPFLTLTISLLSPHLSVYCFSPTTDGRRKLIFICHQKEYVNKVLKKLYDCLRVSFSCLVGAMNRIYTKFWNFWKAIIIKKGKDHMLFTGGSITTFCVTVSVMPNPMQIKAASLKQTKTSTYSPYLPLFLVIQSYTDTLVLGDTDS